MQATDLNRRNATKLTVSKLIFAAAGGIAVAAIIVFLVILPGILPAQQERPQVQVIPPVVTVTEVSVANVQADRADVTVKFAASNPNQRSIYMETLEYSLFINNNEMARGQWGEIADGFVVGSQGLLIVAGGSSPIPAVTTSVPRNSQIGEEWDIMVDGSATYTLTGSSAYRLTQSNLETSVHEDMFSLTFP
jgi:hypothetical protein